MVRESYFKRVVSKSYVSLGWPTVLGSYCNCCLVNYGLFQTRKKKWARINCFLFFCSTLPRQGSEFASKSCTSQSMSPSQYHLLLCQVTRHFLTILMLVAKDIFFETLRGCCICQCFNLGNNNE